MMIPPGRDFIIDHKSTSADIEDGAPFWQRLRIDTQVSTYMVGARALGFDPVGAVWDVVHKPKMKQHLATPVEERKYTKAQKMVPSRLYAGQSLVDEPIEDYRARLAKDIAKKPEHYYKRGFVVRTIEEERLAARDAWAIAQQITFAVKQGDWPRSPSACERYGRLCSYWEVCTGAGDINDPLRFRNMGTDHEELGKAKRHLPLVTNSAMTTFQRCQREYEFAYVRGRRPIKAAEALAFGTLLHLGLEAWWKTTSLDEAFAALVTEDAAHRVIAEELLRGYHARWIDEPLDVLAVEAEFSTPLRDPLTGATSKDFELGGKIDAIARTAREVTNGESKEKPDEATGVGDGRGDTGAPDVATLGEEAQATEQIR